MGEERRQGPGNKTNLTQTRKGLLVGITASENLSQDFCRLPHKSHLRSHRPPCRCRSADLALASTTQQTDRCIKRESCLLTHLVKAGVIGRIHHPHDCMRVCQGWGVFSCDPVPANFKHARARTHLAQDAGTFEVLVPNPSEPSLAAEIPDHDGRVPHLEAGDVQACTPAHHHITSASVAASVLLLGRAGRCAAYSANAQTVGGLAAHGAAPRNRSRGQPIADGDGRPTYGWLHLS